MNKNKVKLSKSSALNFIGAFFLSAVLLSGCSALQYRDYQKMPLPSIGTSYKEIRADYGRPSYGHNLIIGNKVYTLWEYQTGYYSRIFYFENGVLTAIQE